jgi:hypothetical protein
MAQRAAIASGNWSNPAIWNGGVLPEPGDIVASNGFTVTIDQNVNVDSITNAATTVGTEVPLMTSNTAPSGIASHSGTGGFASFSAFQSFDRSNNLCYYPGPFTGDWIAYEFATAKKIGRFGVSFNSSPHTVSYSLEAWNGSTWIVIGTHTATNAFTYSPVFVNTTAYLKYRIVLSGTNTGAQITEFYLYDALSVSAVAGGTFILNDGVTVTCTNAINGLISGSNALGGLIIFNLTTGQSATLIGNTQVTGASNARVVYFNGTGTLNWIGNWEGVGAGLNAEALFINTGTNGGIVNFTGNMTVNSGVVRPIVTINKIFTFNMTGNIDFLQSSGNNITGNPFVINTSFNFNLVGAIYGGRSAVINTTQVIYFNQTGLIMARLNNTNVSSTVFNSTNASSIHLMTGPFISDIYGAQPLYISRMHYKRTIGSYYEFRNNSTNGALPPSASAPATRLVSPDTVADSPIPANVRQGTVYSLGSQTGTMIVPSPSNVANNVPVDNTVGTAVLDPTAIWAVPLTSINTLNSIGRRVKNAATVETTGAQIQTTLNNNE